MAEFKPFQDSSSGSENNPYCVLKEDMKKIPSQTSQKGCLWYKQFWIPLICAILFMVLLITVSVSSQQQFNKLTEVENAVSNLTSSVALLTSNQQDSFKQLVHKLIKAENAVANLTSSVALLTSNQQDSNDRLIEMFGILKAELEGRITNLTQRKPVMSCKAGWKLYLSSCYLFSSTVLDWQNSRVFCSAQGAVLLILSQDVSEWTFIANYISNSESHWIGLTDQLTGQWRWIDGTPYIMDKSHWEPGEPNSLPGEDCGELTKSGKLNDVGCSRSFRFICKAQAIDN